MTSQDPDSPSPLSETVLARLSSSATWEPAPQTGLDAVLEQIRGEATPADRDDTAASIIDLDERRSSRTVPFIAGIAAGLLATLIVGLAVLGIGRADTQEAAAEPAICIELEATELAPAATATAGLDDRAAGTRIVLDVNGLPPAEAGTYYEAWISDADQLISAGTFHLRGGDDAIVLWAGVEPAGFERFAITIQDIGQAESSGRVVLVGNLP